MSMLDEKSRYGKTLDADFYYTMFGLVPIKSNCNSFLTYSKYVLNHLSFKTKLCLSFLNFVNKKPVPVVSWLPNFWRDAKTAKTLHCSITVTDGGDRVVKQYFRRYKRNTYLQGQSITRAY